MNDRVLRPYLELSKEPPGLVRFLSPCQTVQESTKEFTIINLECQLKNIDCKLLPNLNFYVAASLVHDYEPNAMHPFNLKCNDRKIRLKSEMLRQLNPNLVNCYFFELDNTDMCCKINDLYIESISNEKLNEYYEKEMIKRTMSRDFVRQISGENSPVTPIIWESSVEQIEQSLSNSSEFFGKSFNTARLKLQVIINDGSQFDNYLTEPTFTSVIENSINKKIASSSTSLTPSVYNPNYLDDSLKILRASRLNGSLNGNDELYLFCNQFDPNDIEVEFFQLKQDTEISWRVFAQIDKTEMHYNCALVLKTPRYNGQILANIIESTKTAEPSTSIVKSNSNSGLSEKATPTKSSDKNANKMQTRVKVYFRLFKPSTKEYSDKWIFYYCPENNYEFKSLFEENFSSESFLKRYSEKFSLTGNMNVFNKTNQLKKVTKRKKPYNQLVKEIELSRNKSNDNSNSMETNYDTNLESEQNLIDIIDAGLESPGLLLNDDEEFQTDNEETSSDAIKSVDNKVKKIKLNPGLDKSNVPNFSSNSNDSDNAYNSTSPIALLTDKTRSLKIDSASQTESEKTLPKNLTLESKFELRASDNNKTFDQQLKVNLENCIAKMNALADRTGKALIKFAKTRSLHELMKTQRFLLNAQDEDGNTPMHLCLIHGNFDLLEIIVDVSLTIPYQNLINFKNHKNLTPLLIAAHFGELEVCEFLLEANADLTQTDLYGCNCIHIACKNKNVSLLKILLKYVEKGCHYSILNSINHDGYAPIHLAVISGSTDLVRELLYMKNLKVNIQDKRAGLSALHHAVGIRNLLQISNLLVNNNAIEIDIKAYNGCTPLHVAIANKNYLITSMLLNHGANINLQSDMHVHCDIEMFQATAKKNNLLRRCIETIISRYKEAQVNNVIQRSVSILVNESTTTSENKADGATTASTSNSPDNLNHVKMSEEVKKMYDVESEKDKTDNDDSKVRAVVYQHNYDSLHYAQNDPWMHEIFKNKKTIKRDLLEKIICYETFRRMYYDVQPLFLSAKPGSDAFDSSISSNLNISKEKLKYLEANKSFGQIKISQQETDIGNGTMETSESVTVDMQ